MNLFDLIDPEAQKAPIKAETTLETKKRPYHVGRDLDLKKEALRLYLIGVPNAKIAPQIGVSRQTIIYWAAEGGWSVKRSKLKEKSLQNSVDSVKEMRERHLKITRGLQAYALQQIKEGKLKLTAGDLIKALEHEGHIMMPENFTTQINNQISPESFINLVQEAKREQEQNKV